MDAAGQLAQLGVGRVEILAGAVEQLPCLGLVRPEQPQARPQLEPERDEALLRAVVEVARDLQPRRVRRLDDSRAGAQQTLSVLRETAML